MAHLTRWLQSGALVLAGAVGCSAAEPGADWPLRDFQSFTLRAPAAWVSTAGGADSQAGRLQGQGVSISYDFGLYSDPLDAPYGARDLQTQTDTVDGLPARWVRYSLSGKAGSVSRVCIGLHVPQVRTSSMGDIRFTALACEPDPASLELARSVMDTLRFPGRSTR